METEVVLIPNTINIRECYPCQTKAYSSEIYYRCYFGGKFLNFDKFDETSKVVDYKKKMK